MFFPKHLNPINILWLIHLFGRSQRFDQQVIQSIFALALMWKHFEIRVWKKSRHDTCCRGKCEGKSKKKEEGEEGGHCGPCCLLPHPPTQEGQCPSWQLIPMLCSTSLISLCVPPQIWEGRVTNKEKLVPLTDRKETGKNYPTNLNLRKGGFNFDFRFKKEKLIFWIN